MNRLAFLLFLLVSAPATLAQDLAPDTQTGNFLYKFPTGWNPVEKGDTTFIYAPLAKRGTATSSPLLPTTSRVICRTPSACS